MNISRRWLARFAGLGAVLPLLGFLLRSRTTPIVNAQTEAAPSAPAGPGFQYQSPLDQIENLAQQATWGEASAVRSLADAALNCSIFAGSTHSIRDRIWRAELAFRTGKQKAVSEVRLVTSINQMASLAFAPEFLKTSEDQIQALRMMLNATMPHFVGLSDGMSPAEAVFVTGFLTQQKLFDPTYKLDEQKMAAWVSSRAAERAFVDTHKPVVSYVLESRVIPREIVEVESALREQLPHEWSLVTICVHLFLDRAGLPR